MSFEAEAAIENPQLSVVIVNYNSGAYLLECIRTALPQVDEILVVDNASSDNSIIECQQHFPDEPKLNIVRNHSNRGFAVACNIGAMRAKGDFLFFLNPDCALDASAVTELMRALNSDNSVGMVGGLLTNSDGTEQGHLSQMHAQTSATA